MCALITLFLLGFGFFGIFGISSTVVEPAPQAELIPMMTPTFTPVTEFSFTPSLVPLPTETPKSPKSQPESALTPTPSPDSPEVLSICNPPQMSDLQVAAQLDNNTLQSPTWTLSASGTDAMTRFTFTSSTLGGVAMIDVLHYDCGYTDDDIDAYFTDATWAATFASYTTWEETAYCVVDRLRLREFSLTYSGYTYYARYWITPVSEQRVASFLLVLPEWELDGLGSYAEHLFPDLVSCGAL